MNKIMYKIVATTKEGVTFENELNAKKKDIVNIVFKLKQQGLEVEVYQIKKIFG